MPKKGISALLLSKAIEGFLLEFTLHHSASTAYRAYHPALRHLTRYLGDPQLDAISPTELRQFVHYLITEYAPARNEYSTRKDTPLSGSTIDNYWKALRSFFRWARENSLLDRNPAIDLPRPKFAPSEIQPFTEDEIKRLLKAAEYTYTERNGKKIAVKRPTAKRNLALLLLMLDTGLRLGEIARLKIADVRLDAREVYVTPYGTGKKTKSRTVPIGKATSVALWHYLSQHEFDPTRQLFSASAKSIRALVQRLGKAAAVTHTHPHRFRHTFAIEYLRNGGDIFTLQRILGHSSLDMVRRYLNIAQADIQSAHRRAGLVDNLYRSTRI